MKKGEKSQLQVLFVVMSLTDDFPQISWVTHRLLRWTDKLTLSVTVHPIPIARRRHAGVGMIESKQGKWRYRALEELAHLCGSAKASK